MIKPGVPSTIDRDVLQSYLCDHLTGAAGGRARARKMSEWYSNLEIGPELARVADEISAEHDLLEGLINTLDLGSGGPKRLVARVGEVLGRLKPNRHGFGPSPVTPLLEIELLRGAVNGKQGLWQVLVEYAVELGLDPRTYRDLARMTEDQVHVLERLHAELRPTALRPIPASDS